MRGSIRLGFTIAALFAAGVLGFHLFASRHESWFVRAAANNAAHCLTKNTCERLGVGAAISPLPATSRCAKPGNWHELTNVSNGQTSIVVTCTDGRTFLYHMGALKGRGSAQWMVCAEPTCNAEINHIAERMKQ